MVTEHILEGIDLSEAMIFSKLEAYEYKIYRGEFRIGASAASPEIAKHLKCKTNDPILVDKKTFYIESNLPITFTYVAYCSDRYEYYVD